MSITMTVLNGAARILFRFRCGYFLEYVLISMAGNTGTSHLWCRLGFLLGTADGGKCSAMTSTSRST